jgi:hypothetical protein
MRVVRYASDNPANYRECIKTKCIDDAPCSDVNWETHLFRQLRKQIKTLLIHHSWLSLEESGPFLAPVEFRTLRDIVRRRRDEGI